MSEVSQGSNVQLVNLAQDLRDELSNANEGLNPSLEIPEGKVNYALVKNGSSSSEEGKQTGGKTTRVSIIPGESLLPPPPVINPWISTKVARNSIEKGRAAFAFLDNFSDVYSILSSVGEPKERMKKTAQEPQVAKV